MRWVPFSGALEVKVTVPGCHWRLFHQALVRYWEQQLFCRGESALLLLQGSGHEGLRRFCNSPPALAVPLDFSPPLIKNLLLEKQPNKSPSLYKQMTYGLLVQDHKGTLGKPRCSRKREKNGTSDLVKTELPLPETNEQFAGFNFFDD